MTCHNMGRQLLSLDHRMAIKHCLTCNFNSKLSLIFLWLATRPLKLEIFDSKSEISFSIFSSSTVFKSTMGWSRWRHAIVFCWLLENDFRKAIFDKSTTSNGRRKIVTHLEEEKISLPNYYQHWKTINLLRKNSVPKKNLKKSNHESRKRKNDANGRIASNERCSQ